MNLADRAAVHAALGDAARLLIVEELSSGDRTVTELRDLVDVPGNLLAHHLDVLEGAALIERRRSEGDHRRRYVVLRPATLAGAELPRPLVVSAPLFVCTHNSARSQFAAALWNERGGPKAESAGTDPAPAVHPMAVAAASDFGIDLGSATPHGYESITKAPELVISVCDRARETGPSLGAAQLHWSIPDPVASGTAEAFQGAFDEIVERVDRLTNAEAR